MAGRAGNNLGRYPGPLVDDALGLWLQLHDPKLSSSPLLEAWPGNDSYALCRNIFRQVSAAPGTWLLATLRREGENVADAAPYFYKGFNGLS